jgi:hypothetical protein
MGRDDRGERKVANTEGVARRLVFPVVLLAAATVSSAGAQDDPGSAATFGGAGLATPERSRHDAGAPEDRLGFVIGNVEYLLVHEIAHLIITEKKVPIIGPVENAADYLATLALISEEPLDPAHQDRGRDFLLATAGAFAASWEAGRAVGAEMPYWDEHGLSIQRYHQIACLLYGSDPQGLPGLRRATGMSEARAQGCVAEFARAKQAFEWLLRDYGRRLDDPPGAPTKIVYEAPPTHVSSDVLRQLKSMALLEHVIERLHEQFTLERPVTLVMKSCGRREAAWLPDKGELVICYELLDALYLLGGRAAASEPRASSGR